LRRRWITGVAIAATAAGAVVIGRYWHQLQSVASISVTVPGGDGGGWPRATPVSEGFDAIALQRAADYARSSGAQAFLVTRHAHLLLEQYGAGVDAHSSFDGGAFAELLAALAAGIAVRDNAMPEPQGALVPDALAAQIAAASRLAYPTFLSRNLWQVLNAAPAQIRLAAPTSTPPAGCCFLARPGDWLRVAELLISDGRFEGAQVLPAGWARRVQQPVDVDAGRAFGVWLAAGAHGAEPFIDRNVLFLRGSGRTRLWIAPRQQITILVVDQKVADGGSNDETRLPNRVLRALREGPTGANQTIGELVPNH
jgi:hypothetical protein